LLETDFRLSARWREDRSTTTYQNALYSAEMLRRAGIPTALVVTNCWHMARALWSFRAVGYGLLPAQLYKWRRLAELGVIGVPGASELPSFVAVEITKEVSALPMPVAADKPAEINDVPRRRRRKKAGLIEIELAGGRRVRVDRDVDAAAFERVLDVLARR
jgi:transposase